MPWLWRRKRRWNRWNPWINYRRYSRRRQYRYRRPRRFIRRRYRTYRVRRNTFKKKLKKLHLVQWQPKVINKCSVKGFMCLFQCGPGRESFNYAQYMNSLTPEKWPGGGGWSIMIYNLGAMWEQRQLIHNFWNKSNLGLPLVRYTGCKFKFYRTEQTDYIVHYRLCYPMTDTEQEHVIAQPSLMTLLRKKIVVPSKRTKPRGKPYIIKKLKPPSELTNKWYFQKDFCNTGFLLLTTTACSLDRWFLNPYSRSDSITLLSLNTKNFKSRNFQLQGTTNYYVPLTNKYYLYATANGNTQPNQIKRKELIYLGSTMKMQPGMPGANSAEQFVNVAYMGSPFWYEYTNGDRQTFVSNTDPKTLWTEMGNENGTTNKLTPQSNPTLVKCRYTPSKDTGIGNQVFILKNTRQEEGWDPPEDQNLIISGYPLWAALWGWIDWQKKLKIAQQIDYNYIIVIISDFFDVKLPGYVFLDHAFQHNTDPYYEGDEPAHESSLSPSNQQHFYPKILYQQDSINKICLTGPGTVKMTNQSIEAKCKYEFYFKWGGCPAKMEQINDPCEQNKYPAPSNILQTFQGQSPETNPEHFLYEWDERKGMLTTTAAKRLKKDTKTETDCLFSTETSRLDPLPKTTSKYEEILQEIEKETSDEETQTTSLQEQLNRQHIQQQQLKHHIQQLLHRLRDLE
nr:MAG: ORF1 [TTV-like mini virus]